MEYFIRNKDATGNAVKLPPRLRGSRLEKAEIRDKPIYTKYIEVDKINATGSTGGSYTKSELFHIARVLFGVKSLTGNKKADAVKFLTEPHRLNEIEYNNSLLTNETAYSPR